MHIYAGDGTISGMEQGGGEQPQVGGLCLVFHHK